MQDIATTTQPAALAAPKPAREPRISRKIKDAVSLLSTGECKTQKAAAERIGVSAPYLSTQLNKPHVQAFIARKVAQNISRGTLRASARLVELIDAQSEHVSAKVSERILTSEGILKADAASVAVNVDVRAGFVIDLTEPHRASHAPGAIIDGTTTVERG